MPAPANAASPGAANPPAGTRPIVNPVNGVPSAPTLNQQPPAGTGATGAPCVGVNCVYPGTVPDPNVNPVLPPVQNPYAPYGMPYPYAVTQNQASRATLLAGAANAISAACFVGAAAMYEPPNIRETNDSLLRSMRKRGFRRDPYFPEEYARRAGRELDAVMSDSAKACQEFIDRDGNIGDWGDYAKIQIQDRARTFVDNPPDDITQFCPNFVNMTPERRVLFWVWVLASMSAPESSCNPNERSGDAVGLFQLDEQGCRVAGVYVSSRELRNPYKNIRCAVARLEFELRHRDKLIADHSRDKTGTYWAVLRGRSASPVDRRGAMRTLALLPQYSDCRLGSEGPPALVGSSENSTAE